MFSLKMTNRRACRCHYGILEGAKLENKLFIFSLDEGLAFEQFWLVPP